MKLRNKKTGEIKEYGTVGPTTFSEGGFLQAFAAYDSLAALNEDWEDYEEPRDYWYIDSDGKPLCIIRDDRSEFDNNHKEIGNYFATKEEAEKAVEELKAWKRLKDKGFRFTSLYKRGKRIDFEIEGNTLYGETYKDLRLLFGGEE